jgi:nucleoside phosphorylase
MKVLVAAPMQREARAIGPRAVVVGAGEGARARLRALLRDTKPDCVLIAGICGALDPSLAPGDLIVCSSVRSEGNAELIADPRLIEAARAALGADVGARGRSITVTAGALLTVDTAATSRDERAELWKRLGAAGIDMETYQLAEAAVSSGAPWIALRSVSDAASRRLPAPITTWRTEADDRRIALAVARRPSTWLATARLAWHVRGALNSLRRATAIGAGALEATPAPSIDR